MILFRLARKEIRNNFRFSFLFVCNLALGLSGLVAIDSFKISVHEALNARAKGILSADIGVGARRAVTAQELAVVHGLLPSGSAETKTFESLTMIAGQSETAEAAPSRLVEMKAIEENYPFYGDLQLQKAGPVTGHTDKDLFHGQNVWVYPELLVSWV